MPSTSSLLRSTTILTLTLMGAVLPMLFACTSTPPSTLAPGFGGGSVVLQAASQPVTRSSAQAPACVAVLPFVAVSGTEADHPDQAERVRRAVFSALAPAPMRDVELAEIDRMLSPLPAALRRNHAAIARRLSCATLLLGTVTDYRRRFFGLYSEVALGAHLELIRARDGHVLWQAREVVIERAGSLPLSPLGAIETVVRTAGHVIGDPFTPAMDELARRLIHAFPAAPPADPLPGPVRQAADALLAYGGAQGPSARASTGPGS